MPSASAFAPLFAALMLAAAVWIPLERSRTHRGEMLPLWYTGDLTSSWTVRVPTVVMYGSVGLVIGLAEDYWKGVTFAAAVMAAFTAWQALVHRRHNRRHGGSLSEAERP